MSVEEKLREMGLELPDVAAPVGAYVPARRANGFVYTSGQLPLVKGQMVYSGKLGQAVSEEDGYKAARICALNALAAAKSVLGDLSNVISVVKVIGFVNSDPSFTAHAKVINGASDLLGQLFPGGHARGAVGMVSLPLDAAVELEMILEVAE